MLDPKLFWPEEKPTAKPDSQGWFSPCVQDRLHKLIKPDMKTILELGAWLGKSTRAICDMAPDAQVITIDTWEGSEEHVDNPKLATLHQTFLVNCWEYKDQLVPIKATTQKGMEELAKLGVKPDLIYIDADHSYDGVYQDITLAMDLWPNAQIVGDDWAFGALDVTPYPVRNAAADVALLRGKTLVGFSNVWWYE
jgi:predicted O-methyltransferase YrrM